MFDAFRNAWRSAGLTEQDAHHRPDSGDLPVWCACAGGRCKSSGARPTLLNRQSGGLIGTLNLLSGGAVRHFSVMAMGVYPYITAQIILQLLVPLIPRLEAIQREPGGQEKIERYTYYLAIPMAILAGHCPGSNFGTLGGQSIIPGFGSDILLTLAVVIDHDRRDDVRYLVGRTHYRAGHWQWFVDHYFRRHRGASADQSGAADEQHHPTDL